MEGIVSARRVFGHGSRCWGDFSGPNLNTKNHSKTLHAGAKSIAAHVVFEHSPWKHTQCRTFNVPMCRLFYKLGKDRRKECSPMGCIANAAFAGGSIHREPQ